MDVSRRRSSVSSALELARATIGRYPLCSRPPRAYAAHPHIKEDLNMQCLRALAVAFVYLAIGIAMGASLAHFRPAGAETKTSDGVIHFDAKEVAAAFEKGSIIRKTDEYKIMAGHRDKGGVAELHDADTDIFYILDGEATFITGGRIIDPKIESPGETRGSKIDGGQSRQLVKGDVVVIPRGVPHWFSAVPKMVNYFVVKVTAEAKAK
jgi:quercetin dioxygenase-like cupin family protein